MPHPHHTLEGGPMTVPGSEALGYQAAGKGGLSRSPDSRSGRGAPSPPREDRPPPPPPALQPPFCRPDPDSLGPWKEFPKQSKNLFWGLQFGRREGFMGSVRSPPRPTHPVSMATSL